MPTILLATGNQAKQGRLAASRGSHQHKQFPVFHFQAHVLHGGHQAVPFGHVLKNDAGHD